MTGATSILITGASGGIGRAAAIECAARGARIGVHYNRNRDRAEETLAALDGDGHCLLQCDILDPQSIGHFARFRSAATRSRRARDGLAEQPETAAVVRLDFSRRLVRSARPDRDQRRERHRRQ